MFGAAALTVSGAAVGPGVLELLTWQEAGGGSAVGDMVPRVFPNLCLGPGLCPLPDPVVFESDGDLD